MTTPNKYIFLRDPKTGKYYEPNEGWEVTGPNLEQLFHEIGTDDLQPIEPTAEGVSLPQPNLS